MNGIRVIREAREADLLRLQEIERAAGRVFADVGMQAIADDEPLPLETLRGYQQDGRAWVYVDGDVPAAYLIADVVDGNGHVEQVSVDPAYARRGIGRALLEHAAEWARDCGAPALTLTTFTGVAWNGPYYERCGFRVLADDELTPGLVAVRQAEAAHGLYRWPRACMRREL